MTPSHLPHSIQIRLRYVKISYLEQVFPCALGGEIGGGVGVDDTGWDQRFFLSLVSQ